MLNLPAAVTNVDGPISTVSSKYDFISTARLIGRLADDGFEVVSANQGRKTENPYAFHKVELTHPDLPYFEVAPGDRNQMRVVIYNSHNKSVRFCIHAGLFRATCANGCVFGNDAWANTIRRRHINHGVDKEDYIEGVYRVVEEAKAITQDIMGMSQIMLNETKQLEFATRATELRWKTSPIDPHDLLRPRRIQDVGDSLWLTYQRIQEGLIKGGMPGVTSSNRVRILPGLRNVNRDRKINLDLWKLAREYAA